VADLEDLGPVLERFLSGRRVPGIAAAVVKEGRMIAHGAAGLRVSSGTDPLRVDDRFHIASCTKSLTAMIAASLVEQGELSWTTTVGESLGEAAAGIRPEYRDVTLQDLLSHAGGLPPYTSFDRERGEAFVLNVLRDEPPIHATGQDAYSNAGYALVAVMEERATGRPWESLLRDHVAVPLGMQTVVLGWPTRDDPDQPRGHYEIDGRVRVQPRDHPFLVPCLWPAGAVSCTVDDMARYAADQLNGLKGRPALLRPDAYAKIHSCPRGGPDGFTLGWGVRHDAKLGAVHFGAGSGGSYFFRIQIVPSLDLAIVVAANSGDAAAATRDVIDGCIDRYRAE
jgi:CubicO group peptidase (beta-lactamase class C family)